MRTKKGDKDMCGDICQVWSNEKEVRQGFSEGVRKGFKPKGGWFKTPFNPLLLLLNLPLSMRTKQADFGSNWFKPPEPKLGWFKPPFQPKLGLV